MVPAELEYLAAIAAVVGTLPAVFGWLADRTRAAGRHKQLQKTLLQLQAIEIIDRARDGGSRDADLVNARDAAFADALQLLQEIRGDLTAKEEGKVGAEVHIPRFRKVLLLYWPDTVTGALLHSIFYMLAAFILLAILASGVDGPNGRFSITLMVNTFLDPDYSLGVLAFLVLAALMNLAAQRYGTRHARRVAREKRIRTRKDYEKLSAIRRFFLIFVPPRPADLVLVAFFYATILVLIVASISIIQGMTGTVAEDATDFREAGTWLAYAFFVLLALAARALAIRVGIPRGEAQAKC